MGHRLFLSVCMMALVACGDKSNSGGGGGGGQGGCIQGVVVDGLTASRVSLPSEAEKGLFVLVQDRMIPGASLVANPASEGSNPALIGEYVLCGIPLDEEFPVFVWVDGYQPFEGEVIVHSTTASRSPWAKNDIVKPVPTEIANIRLFPKGQQVKDLQVVVTHNGAPLAGANVVLRSTGGNFLDPTTTPFLPPRNVRSPTLSGTTDAAGLWTVPAAELVLGGYYTYTIIPPNGGADHTAVADTFVLGLRDAASTSEPYRINVDLAHSIGQLAVLSSSSDRDDPDANGKITFYFNREFQVVPGTEDGLVATLSNNVTAALVDDIADNKQSDQVKMTIDRNMLTLEPVFKAAPSADMTVEPLLQITYSGLQLRPIASPNTLNTVTVSGTVRFYR